MARNEATSNRHPNVLGPPGSIGPNSPFQGYPDMRSNYVKSKNNKIPYKKIIKTKNRKNKILKPDATTEKHKNNKKSQRTIRLVHLNVEGLTRAKADILGKMFKDADVLAIQETHVPSDKTRLLGVPGFNMVDYKGHAKHGLATYVNQNFKEQQINPVAGNEHTIGISVGNLIIYNVYKPPPERWSNSVLPVNQNTTIYIGDFNSHSTEWGYLSENEDGATLSRWAALHRLHLVYDAKQGGTFESGRWGTTTSPDLCFVSRDKEDQPLRVSRQILPKFPKSQHKPVIIDIGVNFPRINKPEMPRWNLRKARWEVYTKYMDENINRIPPTPENYSRFIKLIKKAAALAIPRGHRQNYIPCWSKECDLLLHEYDQSGNEVTANRLMALLDEERRNRWIAAMEEMDYTHSSRKSWSLLRKLGAAQPSKKVGCIAANDIANILFKTSNIKPQKTGKIEVRKELIEELKKCEEKSALMSDFSVEEVYNALKNVKNRKAAGTDEILPEFLKNLGPRSISWIAKLANNIVNTNTLPKIWRETKVIAILKPNKEATNPKNYRPISLLSTMYKLFERLILARLQPLVEASLPTEQAGFRKNRNCCDQTLALATHIENGFQRQEKCGAVFLDLSSAYDTVWKRGLLLKLTKIIKCRTTIRIMENLLSNRKLRVSLNGKVSGYKLLQNGLPQGSVLSPILFNVYTADITDTVSRKFMYADDVALVAQAKTFTALENTLNNDLIKIQKYFQKWQLTLNPSKSVARAFHLNNREANRELHIEIDGQNIASEECPKYLGVKFDRTLTYNQHLESVKNKLKTRNNVMTKLAGTSWGCHTSVLRTTALALVYSVAEYCAPVWARSAHCRKVDVQLNHTMRIISGTVRSTQTEWLPVLSNIAPPDLRRLAHTKNMLEKINSLPNLPLQKDILEHPPLRLKSRAPIWQIEANNETTECLWKRRWSQIEIRNQDLIKEPSIQVPGWNLKRAQWTTLNRIRTGQGRCNYLLHKWGMVDSPLCECGEIQKINHIVETCTLTKFKDGMIKLHECGPDAANWLEKLAVRL